MAIFSQENEQTKLDYRNYDGKKSNRNVPYILPCNIEKLVLSFMEKGGLNTGSLDIILNSNGEYVFLEVNPIGQFDWLSKDCNYYIEKKIANFL